MDKELSYFTSLIDFPLSKAFWAENQRDMIVATPDDQPHFALLILNDDSDELEEMQIIENPSAYVLKKAQEVIDLTRS